MTLQEITAVVSETVDETAKEMESALEVIRLVASVTAQVMEALRRDPETRIDASRARSLREDALVWKVVTRLKDGR